MIEEDIMKKMKLMEIELKSLKKRVQELENYIRPQRYNKVNKGDGVSNPWNAKRLHF